MTKIKMQLLNKSSDVLADSLGEKEVYLAYKSQYALGNKYCITTDQAPTYLWVQLEASLTPVLIYLAEKEWIYEIPFNIQREWPYPDGAFLGKNHYAWVREANSEEISVMRNLAENSHDQHPVSGAYPHAFANAETRGETVFFAKNAIDGIKANEKHGSYPFQSWGIDQRDDAELTLDFGRPVEIEYLKFILRADYPHDSYWTSITITFSNGSTKTIHPVKTADAQIFPVLERNVSWLKLSELVKDKDMSTFPALTEIEAWGRDKLNN